MSSYIVGAALAAIGRYYLLKRLKSFGPKDPPTSNKGTAMTASPLEAVMVMKAKMTLRW